MNNQMGWDDDEPEQTEKPRTLSYTFGNTVEIVADLLQRAEALSLLSSERDELENTAVSAAEDAHDHILSVLPDGCYVLEPACYPGDSFNLHRINLRFEGEITEMAGMDEAPITARVAALLAAGETVYAVTAVHCDWWMRVELM